MPLPAFLAGTGLRFILGSLFGGLIQAAGSMVGQVLISLGIGYVVYSGVDVGMTWVKDEVMARFNALPPEIFTILSLMQVPSIVNAYFSAWMAGLAISGLQAGSLVKRVQRKPA